MAGLLERYKDYFPITEKTPLKTLGEGGTPLVKLHKIGKELGIELYGNMREPIQQAHLRIEVWF